MWIKNVTSIRKLWEWCGINDLFLLFIYAIDEVEKWILSDFFFFLRKFQPMASVHDDNSLSSDQNTNQFLV